MVNTLKTQIHKALKIALAFTPWVLSIYLLYWIGKHEIWVPETAHRDKITILVLIIGMGLSFLLKSYFDKHKQK